MTSDVEYLLLREKGPYHDVYVRRRLNTNPGACKFYTIVIAVISVCLLVLLLSLVYVFVLVPSWHQHVLSWNSRGGPQESRTHVLTHTRCGTVEGVVDGDVFIFKGIPYSLPPVGARRWDRPHKLEGSRCWHGVYQAKTFGDMCLQPRYNSSAVVGSEDCLYLNVWTQHLDPSDNLPVMVWIHGGYLLFGSGSMSPFCPTSDLTRSMRAVFVSMNYRLGPMGFLALDVLRKGSTTGSTGNYGLMDIILALQWVRDNIRNFGGNPNMVTVFGQRAGGTAIHALLASPLARGLFHRAWLASPSLILNKTSAQASEEDKEVLHLTGCSDAACLRNLSSADVMQKTPWGSFPVRAREDPVQALQGHLADSHITVDGYVLKETPLQAWRHHRGNDIPLLFTTSAHSRQVRLPQPKPAPPRDTAHRWTWERYTAAVRTALAPLGPSSSGISEKALLLYPATSAVSPQRQLTRMTSDVLVTCPVRLLVKAASSTFRSPVFQAVVTSSPSSVPFAAAKTLNDSVIHNPFALYTGDWDLLAFFGDFDFLGFRPSKKDFDFQRLVRREVVAFAREGRPETRYWDAAQNCTALLSDHVFPVRSYNKERCQFWVASGLYSLYERMN
ncbi:neurotactin-like [Babylonia areolata]|uniref:neurotactin-like n=1 Tax=Babylonia areolata TaxID=304850 RepID=UPI003FD633E3